MKKYLGMVFLAFFSLCAIDDDALFFDVDGVPPLAENKPVDFCDDTVVYELHFWGDFDGNSGGCCGEEMRDNLFCCCCFPCLFVLSCLPSFNRGKKK